ncbi:aldo/keto reductase [Streptomyces sp. NBC_00271]|uniref:aldo/keto reductase n=1 Tax=Streptomyces mirabilis TaxID=68239 RepID=UPI002E2B4D0C|nr:MULTISPECIES: aldo/keto reductase [Streptomyces]
MRPAVEYSLAARSPDRELLPMARALGLTVTAWSPLARGLLVGKRPLPGSPSPADRPWTPSR